MAIPNSIANQPLRLQTNEKPTFFNKELAIGAALGVLLPIPFGGLIGAAIGGFVGNQRMHHEAEHGKEIKEPSLFNKGLAIGALAPIAMAALGLDAIVASVGGPAIFEALDALKAGSITLSSSPALMSMAVLSVGALVTTPITAALGAFSGKSEMAKEKSQAISQLQNFAMSQHYNKTQEPNLEQEMDAPSKKFATMIEQQRAQAQGADIDR